jgi:hypothetical protein
MFTIDRNPRSRSTGTRKYIAFVKFRLRFGSKHLADAARMPIRTR